jgi:hypothetical protein
VTGRVGRPQGRARGNTEQANALAEFLLTLTSKMTVRELANRYPVGKTLWGQYRSGQKVIPLELLTRLVEDHVPDERSRQVRLETAVRLYTAALDATLGTPAPTTATTTSPEQAKPSEPSGAVAPTTGVEAGEAFVRRRRRARPLLFGGGVVLVVLSLLVPLVERGPASAPRITGTAAPFAGDAVFAIRPGQRDVFQWDGTDATGWTKIGEAATRLWSGPAGLFAVGTDKQLRKYGGRPGLWSTIGEPGHDVAISGSYVYRLDGDRKAVRVWDGWGTSWTRIGGPAARLYGGEPGLFATDPNDGRIFHYLGQPDLGVRRYRGRLVRAHQQRSVRPQPGTDGRQPLAARSATGTRAALGPRGGPSRRPVRGRRRTLLHRPVG